MNFADWLKKSGLKPSEVAKEINVSPQAVTNYLAGIRTPRPSIMLEIQRISGGQVKLSDWVKQ